MANDTELRLDVVFVRHRTFLPKEAQPLPWVFRLRAQAHSPEDFAQTFLRAQESTNLLPVGRQRAAERCLRGNPVESKEDMLFNLLA